MIRYDTNSQGLWEQQLRAPGSEYVPDLDHLFDFLRRDILPTLPDQGTPPEPTAGAAAALALPVELAKLTRYEAHLDRKLERAYAMLLRMQKERQTLDGG